MYRNPLKGIDVGMMRCEGMGQREKYIKKAIVCKGCGMCRKGRVAREVSRKQKTKRECKSRS